MQRICSTRVIEGVFLQSGQSKVNQGAASSHSQQLLSQPLTNKLVYYRDEDVERRLGVLGGVFGSTPPILERRTGLIFSIRFDAAIVRDLGDYG